MKINRTHPMQLLLSLTQTVTTECAHSLVCIPDRDTAECELAKLKREYGQRFIRFAIRKARPGKRSTYTLRYFTLETEIVPLF